MSLAVVVLLAAMWTAILVPALFRGRQDRSPVASVDSFERSMDILAAGRIGSPRPVGRHVMVVHDPQRLAGRSLRTTTLRRRRQVLQGLAVAVSVTGLGALLAGGVLAALFVLAALALTAYVALLVWMRSTAQRARRVVRRIDAADAPRARPVSGRRVADRIA